MADASVDKQEIKTVVRRALNEDLLLSSITDRPQTSAVVNQELDPSLRWVVSTDGQMELTVRQAAILCGTEWFDTCQKLVDSRTEIVWHKHDGQPLEAGQSIAVLTGNSRSLLLAERSALNFLQLLSATATVTREYQSVLDALPADCHCRLLDTRKTLPGLRRAQKYAVRCGGGHNHRFGLSDGLMFKDNHLLKLTLDQPVDLQAWRHWRQENPEIEVVIEVESLTAFDRVAVLQPDRILIDNLTPAEAIPFIERAHALGIAVEASGNIDTSNLAEYALTGVDCISVGRLTKNVRSIDFSLNFIDD